MDKNNSTSQSLGNSFKFLLRPSQSLTKKRNPDFLTIMENNNRRLSTKIDVDVEERKQMSNSLKNILESKCTAATFGNDEIRQECYFCDKCDPKHLLKLCENCFLECHFKCHSLYFDKNMYKGEKSTFVCDCFKKLNHILPKDLEKKLNSCIMKILDHIIIPNKYFFCGNDNQLVCSFCYFICHGDCHNKKIFNNIKEINGLSINNLNNCYCRHVNHSDNNEFLFCLNFKEYQKELGIRFLPLQCLNLCFQVENIFETFTQTLIKDHRNKEEFKNKINICFPLLNNICFLMNRKLKYSFYNDKILNIFSYERLSKLIRECSVDSVEEIKFKFALIHICLFIHLKRLFNQFGKCLVSSNYISGSIMQRLFFRQKLNKLLENNNNSELKFKIEDNKNLLLENLFPCLLELVKKPFYSLILFRNEIIRFFKYLCFLIKKNIFTMNQLKKIIDYLNLLHDKMIFEINFDDEIQTTCWIVPFSLLSEIFVLLTIEYNDLVVEDLLLHNNKSTLTNGYFVHYQNQYGQKLIRMILRANTIIRKHIQLLHNTEGRRFTFVLSKKSISILKGEIELDNFNLNPNVMTLKKPSIGIILDKYVQFYTESIKLFTLGNNVYVEEIKKLSNSDIESFLIMDNKNYHFISNNNIFGEFKNNIINKIGLFFINFKTGEQLYKIEKQVNSIIDDLINKIRQNNEDNELNSLNITNKSNYSMNEDDIYNYDFYAGTKKEKYKNYIKSVLEFNIDNNPDFFIKIYNKFNEYENEILLSNLDEIITNLFVFFSGQKTKIISYQLFSKLISLLTLFFMSKKTINHFIIGNNLKKINKFFHQYCITIKNLRNYHKSQLRFIRKLLEFCQLMTEGILTYAINLKEHVFLPNLQKYLLYEHLTEFRKILQFENNESEDSEYISSEYNKSENENSVKSFTDINISNHSYVPDMILEFKIQLNIIMKIFLNLNKFYDFEDFINMKNRFLELYHDFFDDSLFFKYYAFQNNKKFYKKKTSLKIVVEDNSNLKKNSFIKKASIEIVDENLFEHDNKIDITLLLTFFEIYSQETYFLGHEKYELLIDISKFFVRPGLKKETRIFEFFENNNLNLEKKYFILRFLRTICFIEKKQSEHIKEIRKSLSSEDYIKMLATSSHNVNFPHINFSNINIGHISNEMKLEYEFQYSKLNNIMLLMKLYINELKNINELFDDKYELIIKKKYLTEIVIGTKIIADFFKYEKDIWNKPIIDFYQLTIEFIQKINTIINLINHEKKEKTNIFNSILLDVLTSQDFDIFNTQILYKYLSEGIESIFDKTNINKKISLIHFLDVFDNMQEVNFIPDSLIEDYDYEYFYEGKNYINKKNEINKTKKGLILKRYKDQFTDIQLNNILIVLRGISNDKTKLNYRKIMVDFFKVCIHRGMDDKIFKDLLLITTKLLFYDTIETKKFLLSLDISKLFQTMKTLLNRTNYHIRISRKNYFVTKRTLEIMNQSKLALQFLQLLGKSYSSNFWNLIFTQVSKNDNTTIFQEVVNTLQSSIMLCDCFSETDAEMPNDILIILIANSLDFIKEFIITGKEHAFIVENAINQLLFKGPMLIKLMKTRLNHITNPFSNRLKILNFIKWKVIVLLIAYMNNGQKNKTLKKLIKHQFSSVEIFEEIIYSFSILLKRLEIQNKKEYNRLMNTNKVDDYVENLIRLYSQEPNFRNTLILKNCNFMFILLRILEEKYNQKSLYNIYHSKDNDNENINQNIIDSLIQDKNDWTIHSLNAYKIYRFLNKIILGVKVDVKIFSNEEKEEERKNSFDSDQFEESELINDENTQVLNTENIFSISKSQLIFFVRPYLTFFISKESMRMFTEEVNRDTAMGKYSGLTFSSDFFLFEMIINKNFIMSSEINKFFCDFNFKIFEKINYLLIIIQNIFLILRTYKGPNDGNYDIKDKNNFFKLKIQHEIIAIIQLIYSIFVLIIWMKYKFVISFEKNLLIYTNHTFVFRQKRDRGQKRVSNDLLDFFQNDKLKLFELIKNSLNHVPLLTKLYVSIVQSICVNRQICIFLYSLILVILYLTTGIEFFLVIPVFFICNISPVAYSIYRAITSRFYSMTLLLLMTYLFTYILTWFCYFFLYKNFVFNDIFDYKTGKNRREAFCSSIIQCFLFYLDYGIRTQFGIGDTLKKISYKNDVKTFIMRWIQDLINYFLTIEVMRFLFLGVITEVFAKLRNKTYEVEYDKKNICFICQISRDKCLEQNIDFDEHIQHKHFLWNYVYFLIYLHLNNSTDFSLVEKGVWDKIGKQDFSWIPKYDKEK